MFSRNDWPQLEFNDWKDTLYTVQLWTQIIGKIRLRHMPWLNHSWHVTLYVSAKGLSTGSIPYALGLFEIEFDFVDHQLIIETGKETKVIRLYPRTVADFYEEVVQSLRDTGIDSLIHASPNEVEPAIPFAADNVHRAYDADKMNLFWQALVKVHIVMTRFRANFRGKCSRVHFFWGAFDLAVTRFSGRTAPLHPGGAPNIPVRVMQEAYSHEVYSCGFWPGNDAMPEAVFYAYCYPSNAEFSRQQVAPSAAYYNETMGEFILPYDAVITSAHPEQDLLQFFQTTYDAAATTGNWDRESLECDLSLFEKGRGI